MRKLMRGFDQSGHLVTFTSLLIHGVNFICFLICKIYTLLAAELAEVF